MREILFRGKSKDSGTWHEGSYIHLTKTTYCFKEDYENNPDNDVHKIAFDVGTDWCLPNRHIQVDVLPETVGQYMGILDKNNKRIFEGDILLVKTELESIEKETRHDEYTTKGIIVFKNGAFNLKGKGMLLCTYWGLKNLNSPAKFSEYEIIGNIHDNPDLAKECMDFEYNKEKETAEN